MMRYVILGTYLPSKHLMICDNMFFGFFEKDPGSGMPNGEMKDNTGPSTICELSFDGCSHLSFTLFREDGEKVAFSFTKEGTIWRGTYNGPKSGSGVAKCVLNQVELNFLAS